MDSKWSPPDSAPASARSAIRAFIQATESDDRVVAAFIGGSFASGTWDEHSDLDLYVIVEDDSYPSFFVDRLTPLQAMGELVLAEDFDGFGFDMVVFMLAGGVEGELGIGRSSDFIHIHGGAFAVLFDRQGILDGIEFALRRPTPSQRETSLQRTVAWFWRQVSLFTTAAARNRVWTARGYLEGARHEAIDLIWWRDCPGEWPGGFEKLETFPGVERARALEGTIGVRLELEDQIAAVSRLAEFMAEEGRRVYRDLEGEYPALLETTVRNKLERLR